MSDKNFNTLDTKVEELIQLCAQMKAENQLLSNQEQDWHVERESLLSKNQLARVQLEKVLTRLKAIEQV